MLQLLKNKKTAERIYLMAVIVFTFEVILFDSMYRTLESFNTVFVLMRVISYALVMMKLLLDLINRRFRLSDFIIIGAGGILLLFVAKHSGYKDFLIYWAFIAAAHDQCIQKVLKCVFFTHIGAGLIIIGGALFGIIPNNVSVRDNGKLRCAFGFFFGSLLSHFMLYTALLWTYIRKEKMTWLELVVILIVNYGLYVATDTKSPFILTLFLIFGIAILKVVPVLRKFQSLYGWIGILMAPISVMALIVLSEKYNCSTFLLRLNNAIAGRLALNYDALNNFEFKIFGQQIEWNLGEGYNYVDSSFLHILVNYGYVLFGIVLIIFILMGIRTWQQKDTWMLLVMGIICVHSLFDDQLLWAGSDGFMFIIYPYLTGLYPLKKRLEHSLNEKESES